MNSPLLHTAGSLALAAQLQAATLVQTFEPGEDTSAWNSIWDNGTVNPTFLSSSLGGSAAGGGTSEAQAFSRSFKDNTAGVNVTTAYSISMYVEVSAFASPSDGRFEIVDGTYGNANAANLGIRTEETGPDTFVYHWQYRDHVTEWHDLGITLDLSAPYQVELVIQPEDFTYSAAVSLVDPAGTVLNSKSASGIAFDPNVIGNHQNGNLLFYVQASAGNTVALVDNINIQAIPEPSGALLVVAGAVTFSLKRRREPS